MVMWGGIWLIVWLIVRPFQKKDTDNCLTWAVKQHNTKGGYLVIRWCKSSKYKWFTWPHFLWLDEIHNEHLKHYVPVDDKHSSKHLVPKPWFEGYVKKGDEGQGEN